MKMNELKAAMDAQFAEMKAQFAEVDQRFAGIDQRFEQVDQRFAHVEQRLDTLDARITSEGVATRRHFDVVAEDLKSQIQLVTSAVVATTATLERHINTSLSERKTVSAALDDHEVRLTVLERHRP